MSNWASLPRFSTFKISGPFILPLFIGNFGLLNGEMALFIETAEGVTYREVAHELAPSFYCGVLCSIRVTLS
jgi:hypothetical protein